MSRSSLAPNQALLGRSAGGPSADHRLPSSVLRLPTFAPFHLRTFPPSRPSRQLSDYRPPTTDLRPPSSHLPSSRKRGHAFSLVELLAVVGIIAMLSVAAVPVMRGLGGSQSSRASAQILVSALEQARTAAIISGTNAYLAIPDAQTTTMNATNRLRTYAILRPTVDQDANNQDDFQTNFAHPGWILLSKWERLPGDLMFSSTTLALLSTTNPLGLTFPANSNSSSLRLIGFTPSGGLTDTTGTNGLLFASSAKVTNGIAAVADRIDISFYSGRVRYTGIVTNTNF